MRSLILVISALFVLSLGFLVYYWTATTKLSHTQKHGAQLAAAKPFVPQEGGYTAGGVWVSRYNDRTGDLSSRFRAQRYEPQPDGHVKVIEPRAEFFLYDKASVAKDPNRKGLDRTGRRLEISGRTGVVNMPKSERGKDNFGQTESTQSPTSGNLYDVTVRMFDQLDGGRQTMIVTMNNASFDNESFRIATEAFVDPSTRQRVAGDEVPVKVRGDDYDLDGRGLAIKWNDRDRRLDLLEIEHGETLVLKHPQQFGGSSASPAVKPVMAPATAPSPSAGPAVLEMKSGMPAANLIYHSAYDLENAPFAPSRWSSAAMPLGAFTGNGFGAEVILAEETTTMPARRSRTPRPPLPPDVIERPGRPGRTGPATRAKIITDNEPPLYRATFFDNVHVVQDEQELVSAERLLVDFLMNGDEGDANDATTQPVGNGSAGRATTAPVGPSTSVGSSGSASEEKTGFHATESGTARKRGGHRSRAPGAEASAATQPGQSPIVVHWTGKLQVVPLHLDEPLPPNEEVLTFEGSPVIAHQQGSEIRCARLTYHTEDGLTLMDSDNPAVPVILIKRDAQGVSTVHASSVTYYRDRHVAVMHNAGRADLPVQAQGDSLARIMKATWSKSCTIHFAGSDEKQMIMDTADLEGDVDVKHPQMKLKSQALALTFEPTMKNPPALFPGTQPSAGAMKTPASKPATDWADTLAGNAAGLEGARHIGDSSSQGMQASLRKMVATGRVHCDMTTDPLNPQTIDCDQLTVQTVTDIDGRIVPRTIAAEGDVHTLDPNEELRAQHLFATVAPATQPVLTRRPAQANKVEGELTDEGGNSNGDSSSGQAVELESLTASQDVNVRLKDGTRALADTLLVGTREDGKRTVKLLGTPTAKIVSKEDTILGAIISIFPDGQQLSVAGPGEMDGLQQDSANPAAPGRPIKVIWGSSVWYDGKANVLTCLGNVVATSTDADGTKNRATGQQMKINFVETATTRPSATQPSATQTAVAQASSQPARRTSAQASVQPSVHSAVAAHPAVDSDDPLAAVAAATPAAEATTHPAGGSSGPPTTASAGASANASAGPGPLFTGKAMHDITFSDHAEVRSTLLDPSGKIMRQVDLFADSVTYTIDSKDGKLLRTINVPGPGKMLFEDHQSTTKPADAHAAANGNEQGDSRGTTAFKWTRSMTYDDGSQKMYMEGLAATSESEKVVIDHRDDAPNAQPTRISALEVIADVVPVAPPTTGPSTRPSTAASSSVMKTPEKLPAVAAQPTATGNPQIASDPLLANLNANNVTVTQQPSASSATQPASTRPASASNQMRMQVKFITAHGNAVLNAKGCEMHAERMNYDPIAHWVKAYGSPHYPAVFTQQGVDEAHPPAETRATELDWDMQEDLPHAIGADAVLRK